VKQLPGLWNHGVFARRLRRRNSQRFLTLRATELVIKTYPPLPNPNTPEHPPACSASMGGAGG
jgi:hypothetical protein